MKLFFDLELTGLHKNTTIISLGIISTDKRSFYAENIEYDKQQNMSWVVENVVPKLLLVDEDNGYSNYNMTDLRVKGTLKHITENLKMWLQQFDKVEFWGDCCQYDWVLLCDLFGDVLSLPNNVYPYCFDIVNFFKLFDIDPNISREEFSGISTLFSDKKHNALYDAKVTYYCFRTLGNMLRNWFNVKIY